MQSGWHFDTGAFIQILNGLASPGFAVGNGNARGHDTSPTRTVMSQL